MKRRRKKKMRNGRKVEGDLALQEIIREKEERDEDERKSIPPAGGPFGMDLASRTTQSITCRKDLLLISGNQMKSTS
jgi:hypothetical protein